MGISISIWKGGERKGENGDSRLLQDRTFNLFFFQRQIGAYVYVSLCVLMFFIL